MRTKKLITPFLLAGMALGLTALAQDRNAASGDPEGDRIVRGFQIAPVHLTLRNGHPDAG